MTPVVITIGLSDRDGYPMPSWKADHFRIDIANLFSALYTEAEGEGTYVREDGVTITERSVVFVGLPVGKPALLHEALARLATLYSQESIGLIVSDSPDTLVFAPAQRGI
jgi:hypothetical protein